MSEICVKIPFANSAFKEITSATMSICNIRFVFVTIIYHAFITMIFNYYINFGAE